MFTKQTLPTLLAAAALLAGSAAPATAVESAGHDVADTQAVRGIITNPPCNGRTDFYRVFNETIHCFANTGSMDVWITDVWRVCTGNNEGRVRSAKTGRWSKWRGQYFCGRFNPDVKVNKVNLNVPID